jgi:hypothetical protein
VRLKVARTALERFTTAGGVARHAEACSSRDAVTYMVFAQSDVREIPASAIAAQAVRFFQATIDPAESPAPVGSTRLVFSSDRARATFTIAGRAARPADVAAARREEAKVGAAGLGDLAARCRTVFEVTPESGTEEWLALDFAALVASVALGPILTPEGALLGVKSARSRADRLKPSR